MKVSRDLINTLKNYFLSTRGNNVVKGHIKPNQDNTYDIGADTRKFRALYVGTLNADNIVGSGGDMDTVDGFHASATPTPNTLLALDDAAKLPTDITGSADTVDGFHAAATATPNTLLALNANSKLPADITGDAATVGGYSVVTTPVANSLLVLDASGRLPADITGDAETLDGYHVSDLYLRTEADSIFVARAGDTLTGALLVDTLAGIGPGVTSFWAGDATPANAPFMVQNTGEVRIQAGSGTTYFQAGTLSSSARIWAGADDPNSAPFFLGLDGSVRIDKGSVAGFTVSTGGFKSKSGHLVLDPTGEVLKAGTLDTDRLFIDGGNVDGWRLWVGSSDPALASFRVKSSGEAWITNVHIQGELESSNYVSGQSGWRLDPSGWSEFSDVIVRGKISSAVFERSAISAISGRQMVTEAGVLIADMSSTDTTMDVDTSAFQADDIVKFQADLGRIEWLRILSGPTSITGGFRYTVERALNGSASDFYKGETVVFQGSATEVDDGFTTGSFDALPGEFYTTPGGGPFKAMGGFLVQEGGRDYGPYLGVVLRHGENYNQMTDVARFGRLKGFLGVIDDYGVAIGDDGQKLVYTRGGGFELVVAGGKTTINFDGVGSEYFNLQIADQEPVPMDGFVRFWVDPTTQKIKALLRDGTTEKQVTWLDFDNPPTIENDVVFSPTEPTDTRPGTIWVQQ